MDFACCAVGGDGANAGRLGQDGPVRGRQLGIAVVVGRVGAENTSGLNLQWDIYRGWININVVDHKIKS